MRNHKKIKAIRTKFGITGYGIWCMVLEYLTGNDGNVFEYSELELELMSGDFGVSVTEIRDVLNYCIKLELLFLKDGFINSDSLDERLKSVYDKRGVAKDRSKKQFRNNGKFSLNNAGTNGVSVTEMPQSKVKESKEDKSKAKESIGPDGLERIDDYFLEKNEENMPAKKITVEPPLPFSDKAFSEKWDEWLQYRKERRLAAYVPTGLKHTFSKLVNISQNDPLIAIQIIDQSIENSWQGLFALKNINNGTSTKRIAQPAAGNVTPGGFGQL